MRGRGDERETRERGFDRINRMNRMLGGRNRTPGRAVSLRLVSLSSCSSC
jgi:hypothetical protein